MIMTAPDGGLVEIAVGRTWEEAGSDEAIIQLEDPERKGNIFVKYQ
jgi:hypothetical protein